MNNNRESFEAWAVSHGGLDLTMHEVKANFKMEEDDILCPAEAYEALQKENARLKEELRQYQTSHRSAMPRRFK